MYGHIITINHMSKTVFTITVEAELQHTLFPFTPGAETTITLDNGECIPCAICSDPYDRRQYVLLPLTEPTSPGAMEAGTRLSLTRPRNPFPLLHCSELVLIAGGRGIGQLLTMARERARLGMPFELHYLTTADTEGLFVDELHELANLPESRLYFYNGTEASNLFAAEYILGEFDNRKHVYVSGDADLVLDTIMASGRIGWRASHVHSTELPGATVVLDTVPPPVTQEPAALTMAPVYQLFR